MVLAYRTGASASAAAFKRSVVSQAVPRTAMVQRHQTRKSSSAPPEPPSDPNAPTMLRFQSQLPQLPVPPLASTLHKYLSTVQPHLTSSQFAKTTAAAQEFLSSPVGAELQKRLEARAKEPGMQNWLADWWNDVAYMGYRDPVVVFVSYFFVHLDDKTKTNLASRAASLVKAMLPFRELVETQRLEPERIKQTPLCMDSYKWLFHSSRLPVKPSDTAKKYDAATHNHILFVRKNKFFEVPLAHDGVELSTAELEAQVRRVVEMAGKENGLPIGALTAENRDTWTDAREALLAVSPANQTALERIESAMVVICLDDTKPVTREDISWACWTGNGRNRWYDKHQFVVFENGRSGFLGEHSCMDGTPTLRMNDFMLGALAAGKIDHGPAQPRADLPAPKEVEFKVDGKVKEYVQQAEKNFDGLIGEHELEVLHYEGYGSSHIKSHKASPDAWAQLVKQLAFHKMFGRPGVCYESAQTRKYKRGRTEVIRTASNESKKWAEAMLDVRETDANRAALFRQAVARHLQYAAWASDGQGVDRHLFGLKRMLKDGEPVPEIYNDEAFGKTNHWELSTSQLSSPWVDGWGYGEVVPDGFGLSYSIGAEYIRWTITSKTGQAKLLKHYLAEAATETIRMIKSAEKAERKDEAAGAKAKL